MRDNTAGFELPTDPPPLFELDMPDDALSETTPRGTRVWR